MKFNLLKSLILSALFSFNLFSTGKVHPEHKKGTIVWIDLKLSNNINITKGVITEIAAIITDNALNVIAEGPNLAIHYSDEVLAKASDWVKKNMPQTLENSRKSQTSINEARRQIAHFIKRYTNANPHSQFKQNNPLLAGNAIQEDVRFIEFYMPHIYKLLNARIIDVAMIKELAKRWYPQQFNETIEKRLNEIKKDTHSAREDILESIQELILYRDVIFKPIELKSKAAPTTTPATENPLTALQKGDKQYVPDNVIRPGQIRIANAGVQAKIDDAIKNGFVTKTNGTFTNLKFDDGKSIIAQENALPIVLATINGKTWGILLDGHHDYMSNQKVGGSSVYIEVKDDLRDMPENQLWNTLQDKGYIYAQNLAGQKVIPLPTSFAKLEDDLYRFFVKMAMWECKTPTTELEKSKPGTKALKYPLAVKWKDKQYNPYIVTKNNTEYLLNPPFIEFKVADQLYKYAQQFGFNYKDGDEKNQGNFQKQVEIARTILKKKPVKNFNLIPDKQTADKDICGYTYLDRSTLKMPLKQKISLINQLKNALSQKKRPQIEALLENNPSLFKSAKSIIHTALFQAAEHNDTQLINFLLDNGVSPNVKGTGESKRPLEAAMRYNQFNAANLLLRRGADLQQINQNILNNFIKAAKNKDQQDVLDVIEGKQKKRNQKL